MTPLPTFIYVAALISALIGTTAGLVAAVALAAVALFVDTATRLGPPEEDPDDEEDEHDILGAPQSDAPLSDSITDHEGNPL